MPDRGGLGKAAKSCLGDGAALACAAEGVQEWEGSVLLPSGPPPNPFESLSVAKYPRLCPPPAAPGRADLGSSAGNPPPHPEPLQTAPARVGAAVPRAASSGHRFKRGAYVWETREDANNCSPNADAGLMPLSAADSFPALKSTHHPTLTSHPPWGGRRVPFIRLIPSPPPTPLKKQDIS